MPNFVRACFCFDQFLLEEQLLSLFLDWATLSCKYHSSKMIDKNERKPGHILSLVQKFLDHPYSVVELDWTVLDQTYHAELSKIWPPDRNFRRINFSVEETAFFHADALEVHFMEYEVFTFYRELIIQFVRHLKPVIGLLDFEADWLCNGATPGQPFASWGNYFSNYVVQYWNAKDMKLLQEIVDDFTCLPDSGVLTFIQPIAQNQAWTHRHAKLEELIRKNSYFKSTTT